MMNRYTDKEFAALRDGLSASAVVCPTADHLWGRVMDTLPPLGSFIRPVARHRYSYMYRVVQHFPQRTVGPGIEGERWGMNEAGEPIDDGHVARGHYLDLEPARAGVWRDTWAYRNADRNSGYSNGPLYWIRVTTTPTGQKELF